jgi:hypothetical protein
MVSRADFSPAVVFKMLATMCERGSSTVTNTMKTEVHLEPVVDSEEDTAQELLAAAARVKTMPARPTIERSSISPGVVVVDNSQGIFQLIGPKGKVFVPRRVLLDSGVQPLMLGASVVAGLELTKDTLEQQHVSRLCPPDLQLKGHPFHQGWWWLIIPKAFSNLLGLRGRYSYLDECYYIRGFNR